MHISRQAIHPKLHVDLAWANKISYSLELFHKVKDGVMAARCPICGDSQSNKKATKFFLLVKKGKLNTYCHKCGHSSSFYNFMKLMHQDVFDEYKRETLFDTFRQAPKIDVVDDAPVKVATPSVSGITIADFKRECTPITSLDEGHPARAYLVERGFSVKELSKLMYTDNFQRTASRINAESSKKLPDEPRIVIPFITPDGIVEMIQGRSLEPDAYMRYISIKRDDNVEKVFGRYGLDDTDVVRCVEGPLDSLFVDNCIATCDANLNRSDADVLIWDIQPRNKDILKYMEQAIETGRKLVIWPISPDKKLDINDLIKKGLDREDLMKVIDSHTYSGLTAKVKFMQWKKM